MTTMTDTQAEAARKKLAEYEAAKAAAARTAENEKRAAAREAIKPLADLQSELAAAGDRVRAALDAVPSSERGLADLARNVCVTIDGLAARLERRIADTEPVPEPEAVDLPNPA